LLFLCFRTSGVGQEGILRKIIINVNLAFMKRKFNFNWKEIVLIVFAAIVTTLFVSWNMNRIYPDCSPTDLPHHFRSIKSIFVNRKFLAYQKFVYPPINHLILGVAILLTHGNFDILPSQFRSLAYHTWFFLLGLQFILLYFLIKNYLENKKKSWQIAIYGCLLLTINPTNTLLLFRWFGFAQWLGVFFITLLTHIFIKYYQTSRKNLVPMFGLFLFVTTLTHVYTAVIIFVVLALSVVIFFLRGEKKLSKRLLTLILITGACSFFLFYYHFVFKNYMGAKNISWWINWQFNNKTFKPYSINVLTLSLYLKKHFSNLSSIIIISSITLGLNNLIKKVKPDKVFVSLTFLVPFIFGLTPLLRHPTYFAARMPHFYTPPAIFLFCSFIQKVRKKYSNLAIVFALSLFTLYNFGIFWTYH